MKLPEVRIKIPDLPRKVLVAVAVLAGSLVLFGILAEFLGGALSASVAENTRLKRSVDQATKDTLTANADYQFVTENAEYFERLIKGDRLVPHTRRDAFKQLQSMALEHGLTSLAADFAAVNDRASAAQATTGAYRVSAEAIKVKVGAPLDGQIYRFIADLRQNFPGAAVLVSVKLSRPPKVTPDMLAKINRKGVIVDGEMELIWRTALANQPEKAP